MNENKQPDMVALCSSIKRSLDDIGELILLQTRELAMLRRTIYAIGNRVAPEPIAHVGAVRESGNG